MYPRYARVSDRIIALVLALLAFAVYAMTLAVGAFPGQPFTSILVQCLGIMPRMSPEQPLWRGMTWLVCHLSAGADPALPMNLLSALWGAIAIAFHYRVVTAIVFLMMRTDEENMKASVRTARVAGVGAALALAFCMPFWILSTRCHWATFHVSLFLLMAHAFNCFADRLSRRWSLVFGMLFGVGVVEYPSFFVFLPLYFGLAITVLWRNEILECKTWGPPLVAALLGVCLYPLAAWTFAGSPGHVLLGDGTFWDAWWMLMRNQWYLLGRSLPSYGWLVVLLVTAAPAASALMVARRSLNDENDWSYYILHVVLSALAVAVLLNMPLAPWPMLGFTRILVMPYVLLTALFGYLLAFWLRLPGGWWRHSSNPVAKALRVGTGPTLVVAGLVLVAVAAARNVTNANARPSALLRQAAAEIIGSLEGRTWLVTDGVMDGSLLVEARRQGVPLRLIDLSSEKSPVNIAYISRFFDEPRMQNLAQLGLTTMVRSWLQSDTNTLQHVAVLHDPDLWLGAGRLAVPYGALFLGAQPDAAIAPGDLMSRHRALWERLDASPYSHPDTEVGLLVSYRRHVQRRFGLVANNLGVWMEDHGERAFAYESYTRARRLDPDNAVALMNLFSMIQHGWAAPDADAIRSALDALRPALSSRKISMAGLTQTYGTVRSPMAFASLGREWAAAGEPELAAAGLRRAIGLVPGESRDRLAQTLAGLYLSQNRGQESEVLFQEMLAKDPANHDALLGLARIQLQAGDRAAARTFLERAEQAGIPRPVMNVEWAMYHMATGDLAKAKALLTLVVEDKPDFIRAWAMLAGIQIQERDAVGLYDTVRRVQRIKTGNEHLLALTSGYLSVMQNDMTSAAVAFEKALSLRPNDTQLMEWLIRFDLQLGYGERIEGRLKQLLALDPGSAFGNFVRAGMQMQNGDFDLARDSLMRSIERKKTPEALNDLAWVELKADQLTTAETHVREALALSPALFQGWATLGEILVKAGRVDEGRQAFEKGLALSPEAAPILLQLASLELAAGRKPEAAQYLDQVARKLSELSPEDAALYDSLQKQR